MKKIWLYVFATLGGVAAPIYGVHAAPVSSHLDSVIQQGQLRVCTTGDYKPYSYKAPDGHYEGIDISLVSLLADSLNVQPVWVQSTWKSILTDIQSDKCDIAVGGISVTLERQKKAFFSAGLDIDGKIPLVRCGDESRYQHLEQINLSTVRVIEPAGGTNEAFVHSHLPNAQLILHDNVTLFDSLLNKQADVMITDASEALYQQKLRPGLCAVSPTNYLQYGEKAYLLPRDDSAWKQYVDQWLHLIKATGAYQNTLSHWIATP